MISNSRVLSLPSSFRQFWSMEMCGENSLLRLRLVLFSCSWATLTRVSFLIPPAVVEKLRRFLTSSIRSFAAFESSKKPFRTTNLRGTWVGTCCSCCPKFFIKKSIAVCARKIKGMKWMAEMLWIEQSGCRCLGRSSDVSRTGWTSEHGKYYVDIWRANPLAFGYVLWHCKAPLCLLLEAHLSTTNIFWNEQMTHSWWMYLSSVFTEPPRLVASCVKEPVQNFNDRRSEDEKNKPLHPTWIQTLVS